jgi:hypothetical protein
MPAYTYTQHSTIKILILLILTPRLILLFSNVNVPIQGYAYRFLMDIHIPIMLFWMQKKIRVGTVTEIQAYDIHK